MGAYLKAVVGRVREKAADAVEDGSGTALTVFNNERHQLGDFEFSSDLPADLAIWQNYDLCSFLAGVRGDIRPIVPSAELKKATAEFLKWMNSEHRKDSDEDSGWWGSEAEDLFASYGTYNVGEGSRVFYPLQVLKAFNYDEAVMIRNYRDIDDTPRYFRADDGRTYRTEIGHQYFSFLDWCTENNWEFIIFGIDG